MRTAMPWILGVWMIAALPAFAQTPPAPPPAPPAAVQPGVEMPMDPVFQPPPTVDAFKFWVRAEYLTWWVKNTPLPVSLVTGDPNNPTVELLNSDRSFGAFSGFRVSFGIWLDPYSNVGLEMSGFSLARRTSTFSASSDNNGNPILAFPFINQTPGAVGDMFMPITYPGLFAGSVAVSSSLQLWGAEANAAFALVRQSNFEFIGLLGFRYLNLQENLNISTLSADIATDPATVLFQSDQFNTRNQFYGGQLGARFSWQGYRFGVDMTGKVALGGTNQSVDINGLSSQVGPGGVNGTFPGGFFTQPSNIGHFNGSQFAVVPSVELKLHWLITQNLRAFVGYDFIYWSGVVRPGNQIDRNINLSQSTVFGSGTLSGPGYPMPMVNRTDFWAQGITLGLDFRF